MEDLELQRQVVYSLNSVLYEQLQYKGNEFDYYNPLNSYIHQVVNDFTIIQIFSPSHVYIFLPVSVLKPMKASCSACRCYNAARAFQLASPSST